MPLGDAAAQTEAPPQVLSADIELHCPVCGYSLTGLTSGRCPECGQQHDRERLTRWATQPELPLSFGRLVDHDRPAVLRLLASPEAFARDLPCLPDSVAADRICRWCRLVALPLAMMATPLIWFGFVMLFAWIACEWSMAIILRFTVVPRQVPRVERFAFWRALVHCHAVFLPITAVLILCAMLLGWLCFPLLGGYAVAWAVLPVGWVFWWAGAVIRAARARAEPGSWTVLASILIMLMTALWIWQVVLMVSWGRW